MALAVGSASAAAAPAPESQRIPWTASKLVGSPEPPLPYAAERLFPSLAFDQPIDLAFIPRSDRWAIAELNGKLFSFRNAADAARKDLLIDLKQSIRGFNQAYGFAFHPRFAQNHFIYVCYVMADGLADGSRVSRFTVSQSDPPRIDPRSEKIIIAWLSGGHNGGCLKFGPDGDLYISTGDGAGPSPPDPLDTGQNIGDLLSSILRIDVDHADPGKNYRVPLDNPFLRLAGARPEVWAYGLRNPWKMSFDERRGDLWVGDVGWELWELIYRVEKGGNYGWSIFEGRQPVKPLGKRGPTPIQPPLVDQPHSEAASITGGAVYYGDRLKELRGQYIYGDWVTGKIWALRCQGATVVSHRQIASTRRQIICFATGPDGELYVVAFDGTIYRLIPNPASAQPAAFPRRLSETGLFASAARQALAPGVVRYRINAELWADGAMAQRFFALPNRSAIDNPPGQAWKFPTNAALGKTLSIELEPGHPESRRRLETQILLFDGADWSAYTYRWNSQQTDADLVDKAGADDWVDLRGARFAGGHHRQLWHFASRSECLRCHNPWSGPPLAFSAEQLSRSAAAKGADDRLGALARAGYFAHAFPTNAGPAFANPYDEQADLARRARVYLHVNCAHCHRENAGGAVNAVMNIDRPLDALRLVSEPPTQGGFGIGQAQLIAPGQPWRSVLYYRISTAGQGRMPYLGSREVDPRGVALIAAWIRSLNPAAAPPDSQISRALGQLRADASPAETDEDLQTLSRSTSGALALLEALSARQLSARVAGEAARLASRQPNPILQDLLERFLPDEKRTTRLGSIIRPEEILSRAGNPTRGRLLFQREGGPQCARCHRVLGEGADFGPDLSRIGVKYSRAALLDQILYPSKIIDPAYANYTVETADGMAYSGIVAKKTPTEVVLRLPGGQQTRMPAAAITKIQRQKLSAMPEQLLQGLTAQDAADLLDYLQSLR